MYTSCLSALLQHILPTAALAPLQDYLTSLTDVTSMVVSHDSGFLDAVCTDIVHYEKDKKLKHYKVRRALFRALHLPFHSWPTAAAMTMLLCRTAIWQRAVWLSSWLAAPCGTRLWPILHNA